MGGLLGGHGRAVGRSGISDLHPILRYFCRKMHFFCIFLQFYLHMSKKSSIFAVDLGIVPTATINNVKDMKKTCVFKCQFNETWYRVYECVNPDDKQRTYYQTYVGRRKLDQSTWSSLGAAIGSIVTSLGYDVINDLICIWS